MAPQESTESAAGIQHHLRLLQLELILAEQIGLTSSCESYRRDLEEEIAETQAAFVVAAITEIAVLRADLSGPLVG